MRYPELYKSVLLMPDVITIDGFFNPIKVVGNMVTVYAFKGGKIYEGCINKGDLKKILKHGWAVHGFNEKHRTGYFNNSEIYMHDLIMKPPAGMVVDHINGNGLDNRRCNLRVVSHRINMLNRRQHSNNTTGMTNVHITEQGIYQVAITRKFYSKDIAETAAQEVATILNRYATQDT